MAKKIETYNGEINEFVDWVTGINEVTGENITEGKQVSGKSIRDLLQNRLKAPIYFYYDENNSLYRLFASKAAYLTWLSDEERFADLELGNFVAPSPFTATMTGLSEDTRYLRYGDSQNTTLKFKWNIEGKNLSNYSDSVTVTYSFNNNGILTIPVKYTHALQNVTFDMYPYLLVGTNTVTVTIVGDTTNATTSISFNIEVLDLELDSTFQIYSPIRNIDKYIEVGYTVTGSGTYGRTVEFVVDGDTLRSYKDTINSVENVYSSTKQIVTRLDPGKHTLQMIAYVTINNINYYSNMLYYEFVVSGFDSSDEKNLITIGTSFDKVNSFIGRDDTVKLTATLFEDFTIDWGFYTSNNFRTSRPVDWIDYVLNPNGEWEEIPIVTITAKLNTKCDTLQFAPVYYGQHYLRAYIDRVKVQEYDLYVYQNANNIAETEGFVFKLSAKGRSNSEPDSKRNKWEYTYDDLIHDPILYKTEFHNFLWNKTSGWDENALVLSNGATADIHISPLSENVVGSLVANNTSGFAFEIEFETFNIDDPDEVIISLGDLEKASILITPNSAFIKNNSGVLKLKTNFREGEKVKLVFTLNASNSADKLLLYIINNGVLERGVLVPGESFNAEGNIRINGEHTGIRIYSIRVYNKAISYNEAFANYVLDSGEITRLLTKNNIYDNNGRISEELCEQKLDTILITGPLDTIIGALDKRAEAKVTIERICLADSKYSFKIVNGKIRRHGQSTLSYPVPNFKIWSDSYEDSEMYNSKGAKLYKGRYAFKEGAIPCKKWVLQANYADSSGVHNGGLQRLIQDTWYKATINKEYKLRTPPQNYAASTGEFTGNGWKEEMKVPFPYQIRIAPDSFPCVVFWRIDEGSLYQFLGLYVFMDDKKSDYVYGERSIYNQPDDPFRLKETASKKSQLKLLWNNDKTLLIEVLSVNTPYVNYTSNDGWNSKINYTVANDSSRDWILNWENHFELIYPEPDDIYNVGETNQKSLNDESILIERIQPFTDWILWLVDCYNDYKAHGNYDKFRAEATDHIDLYKLAAYYIFVLRFGLVDSLQRNALIKTYDGLIFWYEPWDMDIALGNKNTGGIAFDPPIDRNTLDPDNPGTFWISGKNGIPGTTGFTSCFLWDALEAWKTVTVDGVVVPGWIDNIVPAVSNALYSAGLTYNNVMKMFDDEYANKWCERMYNDSGHYKYVENGDGTYLQYLQGSRMSHRHWWTKVSFDYWDAKWASGDFRKNAVTIVTNTTSTGQEIKITPSTSTYYSLYNVSNSTILDTTDITEKNVPISFVMKDVLSVKAPIAVFGSLYIKEFDISEIARYLERVNLSGFYNENSGSNLEVLNIGCPWDGMLRGEFNYKTTLIEDYSNLSKLRSLNVRGYRNINTFVPVLTPLHNLQDFYAAGSNIVIFSASEIGNLFNHLELPDSIKGISLKDSSWKDLKFYHTVSESGTHEEVIGYEEDGTEIIATVSNTYLEDKPLDGMPSGLEKVEFLGNTGRTDCSKDFVLKWVELIKKDDNFDSKTLIIEDVHWVTSDGKGVITYDLLLDIAKIGNIASYQLDVISNPSLKYPLRGYIKLTGKAPTSALLSHLQELFGETVFTLGSEGNGLVIDYEMDAIVISVPSPGYTDDKGNVYIKEGGYYDNNGNYKTSLLLQASVFTLQEIERELKWGIALVGSTAWSSSSLRVHLNQNTGEITAPETTLPARQVRIIVLDSTDAENVRALYLTINITKRQYPTTIGIGCFRDAYVEKNKEYPRVYPDVVEGKYAIIDNKTYTFSPKFFNANGEELEFDGTIKSYKWSFTDEHLHITLVSENLEQSTCLLQFSDLPKYATYESISLEIEYVNGYKVSTTVDLLLLISEAILSADNFGNSELFYLMVQLKNEDGSYKYPPTNSSLYKSDTLATFVGKLDLSQYEIDNSFAAPYYHKDHINLLRTTKTRDSENALLFFTNITDLDISNFPVLNEVLFNDLRYENGTEAGGILLDYSLGDKWSTTWFKKVNISNDPLLTNVDPHPITDLEEFIADDCTNLKELNFSLNSKLKKISTKNSPTAIILLADKNQKLDYINLGSPTTLKLKNVSTDNISLESVWNIEDMLIEGCSEKVAKTGLDIINAIKFEDDTVRSKFISSSKDNLITDSDLDIYTCVHIGYSASTSIDTIHMSNLDSFSFNGRLLVHLYAYNLNDIGVGFAELSKILTINMNNCNGISAAEVLNYINV